MYNIKLPSNDTCSFCKTAFLKFLIISILYLQDFDLNYLIDRHIQVAYMIVDDMYTSHTPELVKDIHWADTVPTILPYTEETVRYPKEEPMCGAEKNVSNENDINVI